VGEFCSALSSSRRVRPNHPWTIWQADVVLRFPSGERQIEIHSTGNNGVLLYLWARGGGANLGTRRADELGLILEELTGYEAKEQVE